MSNRVLLSALRRDQCRARRTTSNDRAAQTERPLGASRPLLLYRRHSTAVWNAHRGAQSAGRLRAGDRPRERQRRRYSPTDLCDRM